MLFMCRYGITVMWHNVHIVMWHNVHVNKWHYIHNGKWHYVHVVMWHYVYVAWINYNVTLSGDLSTKLVDTYEVILRESINVILPWNLTTRFVEMEQCASSRPTQQLIPRLAAPLCELTSITTSHVIVSPIHRWQGNLVSAIVAVKTITWPAVWRGLQYVEQRWRLYCTEYCSAIVYNSTCFISKNPDGRLVLFTIYLSTIVQWLLGLLWSNVKRVSLFRACTDSS